MKEFIVIISWSWQKFGVAKGKLPFKSQTKLNQSTYV